MGIMVLVLVDECGDEIEYDRYQLQLDLDEDELDIWKARKEAKAAEEYPEARGFYWEDRRSWDRMIVMSLHSEL